MRSQAMADRQEPHFRAHQRRQTDDRVSASVAIVPRPAASSPKLRPIGLEAPVLIWCFAGLAVWCSGYFKVSGIGTPRRRKPSRWVLVGSASNSMTTDVNSDPDLS